MQQRREIEKILSQRENGNKKEKGEESGTIQRRDKQGCNREGKEKMECWLKKYEERLEREDKITKWT